MTHLNVSFERRKKTLKKIQFDVKEAAIGCDFRTAVVWPNIPESGLFSDFVKRLNGNLNGTCFHG